MTVVSTLGVGALRFWQSALLCRSYVRKTAEFFGDTDSFPSESSHCNLTAALRCTDDHTVSQGATSADPNHEHNSSTLQDSSGNSEQNIEGKYCNRK